MRRPARRSRRNGGRGFWPAPWRFGQAARGGSSVVGVSADANGAVAGGRVVVAVACRPALLVEPAASFAVEDGPRLLALADGQEHG